MTERNKFCADQLLEGRPIRDSIYFAREQKETDAAVGRSMAFSNEILYIRPMCT